MEEGVRGNLDKKPVKEMDEFGHGIARRLTWIQLFLLLILLVTIGGYSILLWELSLVNRSVKQLRMFTSESVSASGIIRDPRLRE